MKSYMDLPIQPVLIVPSGIETIERIGGIRLYVVLIVPSGIET